MKCPTCGFQNSLDRQQCGKCGSSLLPAPGTADWRKEVTEKVRAYGERKKMLTTPPRPIKQAVEQEDLTEDPSGIENPQARSLVSSSESLDKNYLEPVPPVMEPEPASLEIMKEDLLSVDFVEEDAESLQTQSYLGRRVAALLIDCSILVVLQLVLLALISRIVDIEMVSLAQSAWPVYVAVFLAWQCLYYLYFYKTSRQTPGQVFFALELRDPQSSEIPVSKIMIRWLVMIAFHIFNVTPLVFKKNWLILDRLSGTEIRSIN